MATTDPYQPPAASIDHRPANEVPDVAKCPKCGAQSAKKVGFTWWGGALGPRLFHVVKCHGCGAKYKGRTGAKLTKTIIIYQTIAVVVFGSLTYVFLRGAFERLGR